MFRFAIALLVLVDVPAGSADFLAPGTRYRVVTIPHRVPGVPSIVPRDFNDRLEVVGNGRTPPPAPYYDEVALWTEAEGTRLIGDLPGGSRRSENPSINNLGHICGTSSSQFGDNESFFWTPDGGFVNLGDLPGGYRYTWARGINDLDEIVGVSRCTYGLDDTCAFIWDAVNGMRGLGDLPGGQTFSVAADINNLSQVTGSSDSDSAGEAFIWDAANGMRSLGRTQYGGAINNGVAINNLGQIIGGTGTPQGGQGCLWDPVAGFTFIGIPEGPWPASAAWHINDRSQIVGIATPNYHEPYAYFPIIWDAVNGMRDLNDLLEPRPSPIGVIQNANKINNHGQILVYGDTGPAILTPYLPGDVNENGGVELQDLAVLLAHFGQADDASYGGGDVNEDRTVGIEDLVWLLSNFGQTLE